MTSATAVVFAAVLAACGGGGAPSGVATLARNSTTASSHAATKASKQDPAQAFRNFAACMRAHGVNMADPTVGSKGVVTLHDAPAAPADRAALDAAQRACQHFIDSVVQGAARNMDPAQMAKARQSALKFAQCMRAHGVNVPDPQFQAGGRVTQQFTGDKNDPKFQQAQTACMKDLPKGGKGPNQILSVPDGGSGSSSAGVSMQGGGQ